MLWILALLAAQAQQASKVVTPLKPLSSPASWVTDDDYPPAAARAGHEGNVAFVLQIDPAGLPAGCSIAESSGFDELDQAVCTLMVQRARFSPARDRGGKAVAALYKGRFTWRLQKDAPVAWGLDRTQIEVSSADSTIACTSSNPDLAGALPFCAMLPVGEQVKFFTAGAGKHRMILVEFATSRDATLPRLDYDSGTQTKMMKYTMQFDADASGRVVRCDIHVERPADVDLPLPSDFCRKPPAAAGPAGGAVAPASATMALAVSWKALP